jgi:hypothetical protein
MSFEYLIEPKGSTRPRINYQNEETNGKEQEQPDDNENNESLSDKDEFDIKFVQNLHKRGLLINLMTRFILRKSTE